MFLLCRNQTYLAPGKTGGKIILILGNTARRAGGDGLVDTGLIAAFLFYHLSLIVLAHSENLRTQLNACSAAYTLFPVDSYLLHGFLLFSDIALISYNVDID